MPKQIIVQLSPIAVTYGFYTITDQTLTMAHDDGAPVDISGMTFTHHLRSGDNPDAIAAILTGKIRKMMLGEKIEGFTDALVYPRESIA